MEVDIPIQNFKNILQKIEVNILDALPSCAPNYEMLHRCEDGEKDFRSHADKREVPGAMEYHQRLNKIYLEQYIEDLTREKEWLKKDAGILRDQVNKMLERHLVAGEIDARRGEMERVWDLFHRTVEQRTKPDICWCGALPHMAWRMGVVGQLVAPETMGRIKHRPATSYLRGE